MKISERTLGHLRVRKSVDFINETTDWEERFYRTYEIQVKVHRKILLGTLTARHMSGAQIDYYCHRWSIAAFDAVSSSFFAMNDILVPTLCRVRPGGDGFFVDTLETQREHHCSEYGVESPLDVKGGDLDRFQYVKNVVATRTKLSGTPLVVVKEGREKILYGPGFRVVVPDIFVPELIEWTENGFFVLRPFALPSMVFQGILFQDHAWTSVVDLTQEGIIIFDGQKEYRVKMHPTIEIMRDGVPWEVAEGREGPRFLRPRPGRKCVDYSTLWSYFSLGDVSMTGTLRKVVNTYDGPLAPSSFGGVDTVFFDSGYRVVQGAWKKTHDATKKVVSVGGVYNIVTGEGQFISVNKTIEKSVVGSKLFFFGKGPEEELYLFKDKDKSYDAVGGRLEWGESPAGALLREYEEETGSPLAVKPTLIGLSSDYHAGIGYHSFVFIAPWYDQPGRWIDRQKTSDVAPWVDRLIRKVRDVAGENSLKKIWVSHGVYRQRFVPRLADIDYSPPPPPPFISPPSSYPQDGVRARILSLYPNILRPPDLLFLNTGGTIEVSKNGYPLLREDPRFQRFLSSHGSLGERYWEMAGRRSYSDSLEI